MKALLIIVGIALAGFGFYFGSTKVIAFDQGPQSTASFQCGSPFGSDYDGARREDAMNRVNGQETNMWDICRDKLDSKRPIALGAIGLGAALVIGSFFIHSNR